MTKPSTHASDEATNRQLDLAKHQGSAMSDALNEMIKNEAHGRRQRAGDYTLALAAEDAEGLYQLRNGTLSWLEPDEENVHLEVAVMDGGDGRFIPGLHVEATIIDENGDQIGTHEQPFLWHPWLYHYGRNWTVPGDGDYTVRVRVDAPTFGRHDAINGQRFTEPVEVEFAGFHLATGQKRSEPPQS